ncbi:MAG TPA: type II secretion system F family protein [Pedococcus sp.]|nr:type II secretion system F family protein [Pedococcus sp.]
MSVPTGTRTSPRWHTGGNLLPVGAAAVAVGVLLMLVEGTMLALGAIAVGVIVGAERMARRARARRAAHHRADSVVEVCEALAAELRAGQPPLRAMRHCVEVWPALEPVATAGDLGADVPRALNRLAALPGASGLAEVAAAWQVSQSSGGTMAVALGRVADSARRRRATQNLVMSELASAQATARLVAVLPVVVLAMGSGLGSDPWAFLLTTPLGLACLGGGLVLTYSGLAWIDKIATGAVDS